MNIYSPIQAPEKKPIEILVGRDSSCPTLLLAGVPDTTACVQEYHPHIPGALADLVPQPLPWGACYSAGHPLGEEPVTNVQPELP